MEHTILVSQIPREHPRKDAIERAVKDTFERLPGSWRIVIRRSGLQAMWWGDLEVDGPLGFHRVLLINDLDEVKPWVEGEFARTPSWIPA